MVSKILIVTLLCLGINLVNCYGANKKIEDVDFLLETASKYSPTLVKSLVLNRIDHKIEQIRVVSESVGINEEQENLCKVMIKSFKILKSDIELMDETQVICGDDTYESTIKGFINQFALLTETFNQEYEFLRIPDVTNNTPSALMSMVPTSSLPTNIIISLIANGVKAYRNDIKNATESENGLIRVLAIAANRQLTTILTEVKTATYDNFVPIIQRFESIVTIFYRQFVIINSHPVEPTTEPIPVNSATSIPVVY